MHRLATAQYARIHVLDALQQSLASEAEFLILLNESTSQSHVKDLPGGSGSGHGHTVAVSGGSWGAIAVRQAILEPGIDSSERHRDVTLGLSI